MQSGEVSWAAGDLGLASWSWPLGHWGLMVKRLAVSMGEERGCGLMRVRCLALHSWASFGTRLVGGNHGPFIVLVMARVG